MNDRRASWLEAFQALGEAFFGVLSAELEVISAQTRGSLRWLAIALGLVAVAMTFLAVILPMLLIFAVVAALQPWLGWLGAALAAAAIALVLGTVLVLAARLVLVKRFENPVAAAGQRFGDHLGWLNEKVLGEREAEPERAPRHLKGEDDGVAETEREDHEAAGDQAEQGDPQGDGEAREPPPGG